MAKAKIKLTALVILISVLLASTVVCFAGDGVCKGRNSMGCQSRCQYFEGKANRCGYCNHYYSDHSR